MPLIESTLEAEKYLNKYGYGLEPKFQDGRPVQDQFRITCKPPNRTFTSRRTYDLGDLQILCEGFRLCKDHFQAILNDRP